MILQSRVIDRRFVTMVVPASLPAWIACTTSRVIDRRFVTMVFKSRIPDHDSGAFAVPGGPERHPASGVVDRAQARRVGYARWGAARWACSAARRATPRREMLDKRLQGLKLRP
jgi:hypothetical protein